MRLLVLTFAIASMLGCAGTWNHCDLASGEELIDRDETIGTADFTTVHVAGLEAPGADTDDSGVDWELAGDTVVDFELTIEHRRAAPFLVSPETSVSVTLTNLQTNEQLEREDVVVEKGGEETLRFRVPVCSGCTTPWQVLLRQEDSRSRHRVRWTVEDSCQRAVTIREGF